MNWCCDKSNISSSMMNFSLKSKIDNRCYKQITHDITNNCKTMVGIFLCNFIWSKFSIFFQSSFDHILFNIKSFKILCTFKTLLKTFNKTIFIIIKMCSNFLLNFSKNDVNRCIEENNNSEKQKNSKSVWADKYYCDY